MPIASAEAKTSKSTYIGTFLIAFATLSLEVILTRFLSVTTWYHLAFFVISTAMLGMTAGSVTIYLLPARYSEENLPRNVVQACLGFSVVVPINLIVLSILPMDFGLSAMSFFSLLISTIACALPFYFSGIAVTLLLTKSNLPIGKLYASDLVGASMGCLFVLGGLEILDAPSLIIICSAIGALAALSFGWKTTSKPRKLLSGGLFIGLFLVSIINSNSFYGIRPMVVKGRVEKPDYYLLEKWNSFSRVVVYEEAIAAPQYWGASPLAPHDRMITQHNINIDGEAATILQNFRSLDDISYLRYDVTNLAYYLRPQGGACIIGVGGGRDILSAILFGHDRIVGIDVNPVFIHLLENDFRDYAGIADYPGVSLVVDEARSYLSRSSDQYAIIQMSLIDTWASTGAGAFTLSENALYTVEAWKTMIDRLADDGIFTVSRWYTPSYPGETGRLVGLAVASLLESGINDPSKHIVLITSDRIATLMLSKQPFEVGDIDRLREVSAELQYGIEIMPGILPSNADLREIVSVSSMDDLRQVTRGKFLNYYPPTDENPYFFNYLNINNLNNFRFSLLQQAAVIRGNLYASITLLGLIASLLVITIATTVLPLVIHPSMGSGEKRSSRLLWSGALYFSLIGAGFMLVEIALIQRLSVLLSHPTYALGVLLFSIIGSTGIGSYISERLNVEKPIRFIIFPVIMAAAVLVARIALSALLAYAINSAMPVKTLLAVLVIAPLGILMGFFFPSGMRMVKSLNTAETPWYWALNGICGVLFSAVAVLISIYISISVNFYLAALCYGLLPISVVDLHRRRQAQVVS